MKKSKIYKYKFMQREKNLEMKTNSTETQCSKIYKDNHNLTVKMRRIHSMKCFKMTRISGNLNIKKRMIKNNEVEHL